MNGLALVLAEELGDDLDAVQLKDCQLVLGAELNQEHQRVAAELDQSVSRVGAQQRHEARDCVLGIEETFVLCGTRLVSDRVRGTKSCERWSAPADRAKQPSAQQPYTWTPSSAGWRSRPARTTLTAPCLPIVVRKEPSRFGSGRVGPVSEARARAKCVRCSVPLVQPMLAMVWQPYCCTCDELACVRMAWITSEMPPPVTIDSWFMAAATTSRQCQHKLAVSGRRFVPYHHRMPGCRERGSSSAAHAYRLAAGAWRVRSSGGHSAETRILGWLMLPRPIQSKFIESCNE